MDIMSPPLMQQASPAPWLLRRERIDVVRLIHAALAVKPDATIDEVVAHLGVWGVQVSGIVIGMWMSHRDGRHLDTTDATPTLMVKPSDGVTRRHERRNLQCASAT